MASIEVDVSPDSLHAPWAIYEGLYISGEFLLDAAAGDALVFCEAGTYSIVWQPMVGYVEPDPNPDNGTVGPGDRLTFVGTYVALPGSVIIGVEPYGLEAPWVLMGPGELEESGSGDMEFGPAEPGEYSLEWGEVDGYVTPSPNPDSGTLDPAGQLVFLGTYESE